MTARSLDGAAPRPTAGAAAETLTADQAIAQVLAAESEARTAVAQCAERAELEQQLARERARAIAARAGRRVARVQRAVESALSELTLRHTEKVAALARSAPGAPGDAHRLARAVAALADELSGSAAAMRASRADGCEP